MATRAEDHPFKEKLGDIRSRLTEDLTTADLRRMQLHMDLLAQWDQLMMSEEPGHHHDHMDDHDHAARVLIDPGSVQINPRLQDVGGPGA
jgi:hypothetical protein